MKMREKENGYEYIIKFVIMLMTGALFITTVGIAYLPLILKNELHGIELTFLSNLITGVFLFIGGLVGIFKKKELPQPVYMNCIILLQVVFLICMAFIAEFNFAGTFVFLHIINPILATIEFQLVTNCRRMHGLGVILSALIFPCIYLTYAIIYGFTSGNWIYGIINVPEKGVGFVTMIVIATAVGIVCLVWLQYKLNIKKTKADRKM